MVNLWLSMNVSSNQIELKLKNIKIEKDYSSCINQSSCLAIITEWDIFKSYDWKKLINSMEKPRFLFDGRNILNPSMIRKHTENFYSIGR